MMKTVALYCRVSTSKQTNENQLPELRAFAERQGWTVVKEYTDTITGSGKRKREAFDDMMDAASRHEFDLLLFWKLDRFSRAGVRQTLVYLTKLDGWNVGWRSFQEQWFDSCGPFKDAVISIMATLAEQERVSISQRTLAGLKRARREGKVLGRPTAHVDMDKVAKRRAKGESLRAIASDLGVSAALLCKRVNA
ncbi:MAG: recombinase family protein [Acidobacteriia bacterium]|nr:recombinase family protein [Terriglobia bacterium]